MKNINYLSSSSDNHTGSPKALVDLVGNLNRDLYSPVLAVPEDAALAEDFRGVGGKVFCRKSMSLGRGNVFQFFKSVKNFRDFYTENHIDLLHFNSVGWRDSAVVAAKMCRIPIVLHLHNNYGKGSVSGNFNFHLADKIIIVSESMRDSFFDHPRILNKISCIYNGVDLKRFIEGQGDFRTSLLQNDGGPIIGYVGQLSHRKGVDVLIKASRGVLQQFPAALFVIVGADGVREEGYSDAMKKLANELGVGERFVFLGKRDDIPDVMNGCDLMVVPSRAEPFGKVIIEAMACGTCVIGAAVGGIPEIIEDGQNGRLVPTDNVDALQGAMVEVLGDEALRTRLALKGRQAAMEKFSIDALVDKTQALYADLLK
ncbi:glycosyltransferase family 4 protein [Geoalkalibacter halelectricus]|uniref:Glycosyltransferase family 4 protein n=1 Tax=Geoalkalibacter halelectricus TaxID=2847045 RepID=A0ABY5ZPX6_9BACT|nr:glycosyltransferase family 4 protein [Geoalkalibacter halelectricus]MDO3379732.1 glycosyltransferase family 4 protein [Geoalkalibacter halelectricus]UWZ79266.1 glycosyltransferase family 4 protein [Geoalkalibacter halelectricus]